MPDAADFGATAPEGAGLEVTGLRVALDGAEVLRDLDLSVRRGEILALLGPSGCGKTTLLRTVAGLQVPDAGSVRWAGEDLRGVRAHRRRFGMVFQDHALLPHRNVAANVAFGLRMQGRPALERRRRTAAVLALVGLESFERRGVATLSGGEAQRVALARALAPDPKLLLADEPFAALDRPLHDRLVGDVRRILVELGQTAVHVTHDHAEAFALADRVALMRDGRIHRTATPQLLRADPQDAWTAEFLGLGTVWHTGAATDAPGNGAATSAPGATIDTPWGPLDLDAVVTGGGRRTQPAAASSIPPGRPRTAPATASSIPPGRPRTAPAKVCLLIRPEAVRAGEPSGVGAVVSDVRVAGDRTVATFETPGAPPISGYVPAGVAVGQRCNITLDPAGVTPLHPEP